MKLPKLAILLVSLVLAGSLFSCNKIKEAAEAKIQEEMQKALEEIEAQAQQDTQDQDSQDTDDSLLPTPVTITEAKIKGYIKVMQEMGGKQDLNAWQANAELERKIQEHGLESRDEFIALHFKIYGGLSHLKYQEAGGKETMTKQFEQQKEQLQSLLDDPNLSDEEKNQIRQNLKFFDEQMQGASTGMDKYDAMLKKDYTPEEMRVLEQYKDALQNYAN
jgi:hypothetical protein